MTCLIVHTSGLIAALDATHPLGEEARQALQDAGTLIISPALLGEFDQVARRAIGPSAAVQGAWEIQRWAQRGRAILPDVTAEILATAADIRSRYSDLRLDLVDALLVVHAAEFHTNDILTLDRRDFGVLQPLVKFTNFNIFP
ncbi:MAG: PIN domain-containing protein [Angustibacter sp.]